MDFEGLLRLLSDRGIKFIVVGGVACALNGFVRATEDVDILIETSEANITSMLNTLREWGEGEWRNALNLLTLGAVSSGMRSIS